MKNFAKIFLFLFLLNFPRLILSQNYWTPVPSPVTVWLYKCTFTDTLNGWACGDSGTIVHSSDGGNNWVKQVTNRDFFINDICFINKRLGWAVGTDYSVYRTYVFKTTNGGLLWNSSAYPDTTLIFNTVYFLDSLSGYIGGLDGVILKTTDAGNSWNRMPVDSSLYSQFNIRNFKFFNEKFGTACGGVMDFGGVLWITTNYGYNWHTVTVAPEPIYDVVYLDSVRALAAGGDFEYGASFVKTYSGWANWDYNALFYFGVGQAIAMRTPSEIWVPLAFSFSWAVSLDTGDTWQLVVQHDSSAIYDAVFIDSTHGWAVGDNGGIFKFNRQLIGINRNNSIPVTYKLNQNYPNPFNPSTTIYYELPSPCYVKLSVYDVLGRNIKVLVNEYQQSGKYKTEWNASGYPSGVYFYRIEAGNYTETKKMVLLK
jgi:photosystem II stability/assembly factor-like uncharacterized protein